MRLKPHWFVSEYADVHRLRLANDWFEIHMRQNIPFDVNAGRDLYEGQPSANAAEDDRRSLHTGRGGGGRKRIGRKADLTDFFNEFPCSCLLLQFSLSRPRPQL